MNKICISIVKLNDTWRHTILTKYIDINQIKNNILNARQTCCANVMAVVKANCYSNGLYVASCIEEYVCGFAVANVFEGIHLRKIGIAKPILSLSFKKDEFDIAKKYNLAVSLSLPENYVKGLKYHIAIDSGMNRSGVKGKYNLLSLLNKMDNNDIEGIYSHIYSPNAILIERQVELFDEAANIARLFNREIVTHIFATNYKDSTITYKTDMIRLGIGLYEKAVGVSSEILQIKDLSKGESLGYDGEFIAANPMQIALCEGGYFDGIIRRFTGQKMSFNADFCKVLGKISMDSHMIDVTDLNAKIGDKVVVYDTEDLSFEKRSEDMKISKYELMTMLKGRFNYVYYN